MSIKRRLGKMEAEVSAISAGETADEREKRLTMIREGAEQQNEKYFREPPFVIADDGTVTCSRDGLPRNHSRGVVLGGDGSPQPEARLRRGNRGLLQQGRGVRPEPGSPDPEWSRSLYSAAWTDIVAPVEDLSE